jgi:hypothetical protein
MNRQKQQEGWKDGRAFFAGNPQKIIVLPFLTFALPVDSSRPDRLGRAWVLGVLLVLGASGCVTVRPEQRAVLADPTMQFDNDPGDGAAREHVIENREGASGGTSVKGGGCGCN